MSGPSQADMIAAYQRLLDAQRAATSGDDRQAADDDLTHFLMMHAHGRLPEWFASRPEFTANDREDA